VASDAVQAVTFLFSSIEPPADGFFQGYFFAGHDFVFGEYGAREFTSHTGSRIAGGLDGCYVTVRHIGDEFHFDLDQSGYKLLFYYGDGEFWALSNSFARLVGHLRDHGRPVVPNYAQLAAILPTDTARLQLFSFETPVRGVRLAPRATTLVASPDGIRLVRRIRTVTPESYAVGLRDHLHTWVGRMETLLAAPDIDFIIQVTGGVDSRTNVALAQAAIRRLGDGVRPPKFACHLYANVGDDLAVARELADHYGFTLNDTRPFHGTPLDARDSVDVFYALNAGVSSPLHLPLESPTPAKITFSGTGGENHRTFYARRRPLTPEQFVARNAARPGREWLAAEFARATVSRRSRRSVIRSSRCARTTASSATGSTADAVLATRRRSRRWTR
jgi:hypothetical protein